MRVAFLAAFILFLYGCTAEGLKSAPPAGVDFSGHWTLNVADSDDPMHLLQIANAQASAAADNQADTGARGGRGAQGSGYPARMPPATPSIAVLAEGLRFPGKQLDIKQVGGVLTFTSEGKTRICQPSDERRERRHRGSATDRDAPLPSEREAPPPRCGWSDKTLIVRSREVDEDRPPFEEHYSISGDGRRLVEEVDFRGGRSNGFTLSRVWDRLP
ncbi:MAG TPA: hypothetical protein VHW71_00395 [Steroidobacteraceae bacterium]|jgi:hypothetical protein|nr:hypothetical protein [Steroidobacteraceae bacterium]